MYLGLSVGGVFVKNRVHHYEPFAVDSRVVAIGCVFVDYIFEVGVDRLRAEFLLETSFWGKRPGVRWVAGYSTPVDFLDATALELFFLNRLLGEYSPKEWVASLTAAANATRDAMPGLVRGLGFRVYRRIQGSDQIDAVLEPDDWDGE
jgi:hypothetical protein